MKRNIAILGFVIGLLLPIGGLFIMYFAWFHNIPVSDFFGKLQHKHSTFAKVLTMSLLINIAPFIFYTSKRLDLTARGIFIATILYALLIVLVKYVW